MVAKSRIREVDLALLSHTEKLANWINRVRHKKLTHRYKPKRDLRVQAVLTNALVKAEYELRTKQINRVKKWQMLKQQLLKNELNYQQTFEDDDPWKGQLCPELKSFDTFMSKLSEIKEPLHR
ncbi:uncharacterized protein [Prorops nasuta]|uniref:uncharacterized protein n=1 Tax=Prorops nasuta TaxID=863751 RepID=UPI0034CFD191